ncbi:Integrator complex subunit 7 [Quillaja saponaria]|uniref:Integrator complex subunit 7 n=1 Tax=Quillaja saponaria TaxID=32244 RepID=A0AAD7L0Y3_QUISA|nr:Integrator complex subunit 7 [Quillaja saponaria]
MERISADCAMEWSIELEKAIRSRKQGRAIEAILQIGPRIEQWSREPESNIVTLDMFGLVPGEDRLFANTILLRLADAFRLGDNLTRLSIARVFLSELKHRDKRNCKKYKGLLSKARVPNHLELLARVKTVFDAHDIESRAYALVLFGCWADFAKDNAQIRYLILSSLLSSHDLEVKASLFAAGCFCELADDFASVVLEMLAALLTSSEISLAVILAGARTFAKLGSSYSVANKAYKIGLQMVLDSAVEDFVVAMLFSLSKLASTSTSLISEQADLLLSFLNRERTSRVQTTALRCFHFLITKGVCPVTVDLTKALLCLIDEPKLPSAMQSEALRILHKILLYVVPPLQYVELHEFSKLFAIAENVLQYPISLKNHLAIHFLVDLACTIKESTQIVKDVYCSYSVPSRVVSLIIDQITLLVKQLLESCQTDSKAFEDIQMLLKLLLDVVDKHSQLGVLVLNNISLVIKNLVNMIDDNITVSYQAEISNHENVYYKGEKSRPVISKVLHKVYRFMVTFLENLNKAGSINSEIFQEVKLLVEFVCECSLFDFFTYTTYSFLLYNHNFRGCFMNESNDIWNHNNNSGVVPHDCFVKHEIDTLKCMQKRFTEAENWHAYKAGAHAANQGAWITATLVFGKLSSKVKSDTFSSWLKFLFQYAHFEGRIQLLLLPKQASTLVDCLGSNTFPITFSTDDLNNNDPSIEGNINISKYSETVTGAYGELCFSIGTLETAVTTRQAFCFQRWFLYLRAKVLENMVDILKAVRIILLNLDNCKNTVVESNHMLECVKSFQEISQISLQLKRLSQELDLIGMSFIDMDREGSKFISFLAVNCAVLAFTAGFVVYITNAHVNEDVTGENADNLQALVLQNLIGRLWHIDQQTRNHLSTLLNIIDKPKNCFHPHSDFQTMATGSEDKDFLSACSYAVSGIVCWLNEVKVYDKTLYKVSKNGLELLLNIAMKWLHSPFRVPKYFFKVRQCIGSELFAQNEDTRNQSDLSVLPGSCLSLNLCVQLRNVPSNLRLRLKKFYCILYCRLSFQEPRPSDDKEKTPSAYQAWKDDDFVEMNNDLFCYLANCNATKMRRRKGGRDDNDGVVRAFVNFELNEKGQGFSKCMLDVSDFPAGCYRIKWHSCCIDSMGSYRSLLPLNMGPVITIHKFPLG